MEKQEKRLHIRRALLIGGLCAAAYLAVYVVRNVLSTVTPVIIGAGLLTTEQIGTMSSAFFVAYAVGQLINGMIGDRVPAKYMLGCGLLLAGLCHLMVPVVVTTPLAAFAAYGATGFFLSMIYGPMTKVVAENVHPLYAPRCSLGYNFSSLMGSPLAGVLAMLLSWQGVFTTGSSLLIGMGVVIFATFTLCERRGIIRRREPAVAGDRKQGGVKVLLRRHIVKFSLVSILTGVVRTTVVFWLPTYLTGRLGYSEVTAAGAFTAATLVIALNAFVAVFVYERLGRNMHVTVLLSFALSALCFAGVYFVEHALLNAVLLVGAIFCSNCAASILWSCYCPSLRDTGMVSSATGFLDFLSYMAAALSSTLFAEAVDVIGWRGLVLVWLGVVVAGVVATLPYRRFTGSAATGAESE